MNSNKNRAKKPLDISAKEKNSAAKKTGIAWLNPMSKISEFCGRQSSFLFCVEVCNERQKRAIGKEPFLYISFYFLLSFF